MRLEWFWVPLGALALLAIFQQARIFQIHRKAKNHEELFQILAENAADMIALVDVKGRRLYNSPAYKRILGYSAAELGETSAFEQIHPDDRFKVLEASRETRESGTGQRLEYRIKHKDGSWRVLESLASTVRDSAGKVAKLVIVNRDITERKRAEEQLAHTLFHDPLTGLPNRRLFLDRLQHAFMQMWRDPGNAYALLLANIDHFKVFNDTLGATAGDHVLMEIARRVGMCLRQDDTIARRPAGAAPRELVLSRLGGDEFTVILQGLSDASDAMRVARRIQAAVAEPFTAENGSGGDPLDLRASMSVGIAISAPTHQRAEDVLQEADVALRRAKSLGGSRCEVFDEAMHSRAEGRMRLEADLRTALVERQYRIYYQPVVQLRTRSVVSVEALLRWEHPQQGLISPYRFIEVAEDTGILVSLGQWMMLEACRQLRNWESAGLAAQPLHITVNLSARQFAYARLASDIQDILRVTGVDAARLQLEMTESVAAADPKHTVTVLSQLKHLGIGVVLDDFGVGSASLRGLWQLPLDALKIDRSLVTEMQTDRNSSDLIEMIVTLAHKMKLPVIAEGIETARQLDRLLELGCEYGQGYYFSQPMDAKAAEQFLRQQAVTPGLTRTASAKKAAASPVVR